MYINDEHIQSDLNHVWCTHSLKVVKIYNFSMFYHAMYLNLQWKGLVKCAINVSMLNKVNWNFVRNGVKADEDLISMCQRCSSSCCLFSTDFCFCFRSLTSRSFRARLLGLISTGRSGFTFFYKKTLVNNCSPAGLESLSRSVLYNVGLTVLCFELKCIKVKLFCIHFRFINHLWTM